MESTRLRLRVVPGAARAGVVGRYRDGWKIRVSAPPERGAANAAVVQLLARALDVRARDISLVSGHGSRDKIVEVAGVRPADTDARLASAEGEDV